MSGFVRKLIGLLAVIALLNMAAAGPLLPLVTEWNAPESAISARGMVCEKCTPAPMAVAGCIGSQCGTLANWPGITVAIRVATLRYSNPSQLLLRQHSSQPPIRPA